MGAMDQFFLDFLQFLRSLTYQQFSKIATILPTASHYESSFHIALPYKIHLIDLYVLHILGCTTFDY